MNKNMMRLVKTLRSGKYKQTTSVPRNKDDHFCFLGVVFELYRETHPEARWVIVDEAYSFEVDGMLFDAALPPSVAKWLGVEEADPLLDIRSEDGTKYSAEATECNDSLGLSFKQLANALERTYGSR